MQIIKNIIIIDKDLVKKQKINLEIKINTET